VLHELNTSKWFIACLWQRKEEVRHGRDKCTLFTLVWFLRCVAWLKADPHTLHRYGFSPVWILRWFHSVECRANILSQTCENTKEISKFLRGTSRGVQNKMFTNKYSQSKRYCPVLAALEGSALWRDTLTTALLHDHNWTIPFGLPVQSV